MNSESVLTVTFLERAPEAAARVFERLPDDESSALLEALPARLLAPVLNDMIPWQGARLLERASASRAAMLLRELGVADSTSLARLVRSDALEPILHELPTRFGQRLTTSLTYPPDQVGAWIDPDVPTLSLGDAADDALLMLRTGEPASHVFVVDVAHGAYVGTIAVRDILRSEPSMRLEQLSIEKTRPISNRASLGSVTFDESWDTLMHLPVIGRRGNLLGGLSRRALRRNLLEQHARPDSGQGSLLAHMLGALVVSSVGTLGIIADSLGMTIDGFDRRADREH